MVTGSNDVEEIFDRMAVIRRERHTNVSESVAGAEAVMDWGRYTWMYPWIAVARRLRPATWFTPTGIQEPRASRQVWAIGPGLIHLSREPPKRAGNRRGSAGIS